MADDMVHMEDEFDPAHSIARVGPTPEQIDAMVKKIIITPQPTSPELTEAIGAYTKAYVEKLMDDPRHPEEELKANLGAARLQLKTALTSLPQAPQQADEAAFLDKAVDHVANTITRRMTEIIGDEFLALQSLDRESENFAAADAEFRQKYTSGNVAQVNQMQLLTKRRLIEDPRGKFFASKQLAAAYPENPNFGSLVDADREVLLKFATQRCLRYARETYFDLEAAFADNPRMLTEVREAARRNAERDVQQYEGQIDDSIVALRQANGPQTVRIEYGR